MIKINTKDFINMLKVTHRLEGITQEDIENMPLYKKMLDFLSSIEDKEED